jgi:tetratricopeptide (TPR) repeat protein
VVVAPSNQPTEEPKVVYTPPVSEPGFDVDAALSRFMAELPSMREKKLEFEKAIEEFEQHVNQNPTPVAKPRGRKPKTTPAATTGNTSEQLLEEIKTSKKKVTPASPKQKEQSEIIDQFIKTKPTISKPVASQTELDLTELTDAYNENVVSETLALILIKQGKKEKAIEVLRKLIWKFPQKKAYFAAQIEDLTK